MTTYYANINVAEENRLYQTSDNCDAFARIIFVAFYMPCTHLLGILVAARFASDC
jgi:hypothetical protein